MAKPQFFITFVICTSCNCHRYFLISSGHAIYSNSFYKSGIANLLWMFRTERKKKSFQVPAFQKGDLEEN